MFCCGFCVIFIVLCTGLPRFAQNDIKVEILVVLTTQMSSRHGAGKSTKKGKKSKDDFTPTVKKKISISGGKIQDVEAQVVDEETELVRII